MFKKALALAAGLLITLAAYAASAQLRADHPDTYVVKKGDTLWSISARFLRKPWLWPEIWDVNQQVYNPHLIYPGDVLYLGRDRMLHVHRARELGNPIPTVPLSAIEPFLHDLRVLSADQLAHSPYVVGLEESQPRATEGQFVYVRGLADAQTGQRYAVARPTHVYRDYAGSQSGPSDEVSHLLNSDVEVVSGPWQENFNNDGHYGRGKEIGAEVEIIGTVRVLRGGDPATTLLTNARMEIRKGDRLLPVDDAPYDGTYFPHAAQQVPANLHVMAFANGMDSTSAEGPRSVVAISGGSADGINNGTTFSIFQPGDTIADDVIGNSDSRDLSPKVTLPEEFIGHVMVFRTFDHVSYGLVMDGIRPVHIGDHLQAPE